MGLEDMSFPVMIGGKVRGVLLAGQMIQDDQKAKDVICELVDRKADPEQRCELRRLVAKEAIKPDEYDRRQEAFGRFGVAVQSTVDALRSARIETEMSRATVLTTKRLSQLRREDRIGGFWHGVSEVSSALAALLDLRVVVLAREVASYAVWADTHADPERGQHVEHEHVPETTDGALKPLPLRDGQNIGAWAAIAPDGAPVRVLRTDVSAGGVVHTSFVVALVGDLREGLAEFAASICLALMEQITGDYVVQALREQRDNFMTNVSFAGHLIRTPAMELLYALHRLTPAVEAAEEDDGPLDKAEAAVNQILFDAAMLEREPLVPKSFNIELLMHDVRYGFEYQANNKGIEIDIESYGGGDLWVDANRAHVRNIMTLLMDNAIKYSYRNHRVRVWFREEREMAIVSIQNYGVGFPAEDYQRYFQIGERAEVEDEGVRRPGSGFGLPHVAALVKGQNGRVGIHSVPPDENASQADPSRHLITAMIGLPLMRTHGT